LTLEYADATSNTIAGCWLGLDSTGSNAAPNAFQGILFVQGASRNIIGGTNATARNVISGNSQYGLWMSDNNTTGNVILGNYIGTDPSGSFSVSNVLGGIGIFTNGIGHVIGGTNAAARNVISGNGGAGIWLAGAGVSNNIVQGNFIGLNATGTAGVSNTSDGVYVLNGASSNAILNNVISGGFEEGLRLRDTGTTANLVKGNFIGTGVTGTSSVPNGIYGVRVYGGASGNTIGGNSAGARNLISGNKQYELYISDPGTSNNSVLGNFIGTDVAGTNAIGNGGNGFGIGIWNGASGNMIGGTSTGAGNLVSGHSGFSYGIAMGGVNGNVVQGNCVGTDFAGKTALANGFTGVAMEGGSTGNLVGGTTAGAGNVISGNGTYGVYISDVGTTGNLVQGNIIGADLTGTNALANGFADIVLQAGATNNLIGGTDMGAGNVIAFAVGPGVVMYNPNTTNDSIRGNSTFSNGGLGIDLNNDGVTPNHTGFLAGPNNLQNYPTITNAFSYAASTIALGNLNSATNRSFFIDFYRNTAADPSGYGEGQFYLGTAGVTTDGSGNALFAYTNNSGNYSGQYLTATATAATGDTSEFSAHVIITNMPSPAAVFSRPFLVRTNGFIFSLTFQTNFSYRIQATTNVNQSHPMD
jgi:titin